MILGGLQRLRNSERKKIYKILRAHHAELMTIPNIVVSGAIYDPNPAE